MISTCQAHALALDALVRIVQTSESEREVRLAATAILRLTTETEAPVPDTATDAPNESRGAIAPSPHRETPVLGCTTEHNPLSPPELAALAALLPQVRIDRFTRKHTPAYWREVLQPNATTGPPANPARAAA